MQNPADHSLICVGCLETIEETMSHSIPTRTPTPKTVDERLGPYAQSSDQVRHLDELSICSCRCSERLAQSSIGMEDVQPEEDVSNKLACKMLQGYTLLSQNCQR